ncbi:MAG: SDR family oxidoreductase [Actinomycetota bacterium]|nr:SDR family oxidoreductase [Actinomycetota bacterium]
MPLPAPAPHTTCLVTGSSSGIGAEIARELARRGHGVTLVARRDALLRALADELAGAYGVRVEVLQADLTDPDARSGLAAALADRELTVDVLVNNAGASTMGPSYRAERSSELSMVRTDVEAVVDLCQLFTPGMASRRRGSVLNTASTAAFQPLPGQAGYGACKAFVLSYSLALRAELRAVGVNVTALCPGPVHTGFGEAAGITDDEAAQALPKVMWVPVGRVAREAVDGMERDADVVIPGMANRIGAFAGRHAPARLVLSIMARNHPALSPKR